MGSDAAEKRGRLRSAPAFAFVAEHVFWRIAASNQLLLLPAWLGLARV
jgi:hypothetical protein